MKEARPTTVEERIQIAKDCIANGRNYGETALKFHVSYQQVYQWVKKFKEKGDSFINPSNDQAVVAEVKQMYATRKQGNIILMDMDYEFFSSDNKAAYSLKLSEEVARLIVTKDIDVDAEWQKYVDDNAGIWQPVVDDLNAAFAD